MSTIAMGDFLSKYILVPFLEGLLLLYDVAPFSNYLTYRNLLTGLIHLVAHRAILNRRNLYKGNVFFHSTVAIKNLWGLLSLCENFILTLVIATRSPTAPVTPIPEGRPKPKETPLGRTDDGYGTDIDVSDYRSYRWCSVCIYKLKVFAHLFCCFC